MTQPNDHLNLVIVGAGVYGICAANTYLSLHQTAAIKVLDADDDAGGVWSTSRSYPQFWSQTGIRLSGYADVPFEVPEDAEIYHDLYEARYLSKYLEDYLTDHQYDGRSLRERFVFRCQATNVTKVEERWKIEALKDGESVTYTASKVIIATGLNSVPYVPEFLGRESFEGLIIHQKDFGRANVFTASEPDKESHTHVTVLGGAKSAADIAYAAATDPYHPRKVSWIIRSSGTGPLVLTKAKAFGQYRCTPELGSTRAIANLSSANPYLPESWWSWFLHKTMVGEWLLEKLWSQTEIESAALANYHGREDALPGFEGLESQTRIRWRAGPFGLLQRDDFWDIISKNVQVYRQDVVSLGSDSVVLEDGTALKTDVLLCCTGWKQEHTVFSLGEAARLGLPINHKQEALVKEDREHWSRLEAEGDHRVLARWPYLRSTPQVKKLRVGQTPYRLYNAMIPIEDQSIAFLGLGMVPNAYHTALAQSLYAIAALDGTLELPPKEQMEEHVAFINSWCRRRYPQHGHLGNVLDFEMVSYTDQLLEQLGLSSHRIKDSWWKDLTDPCLASDYAGLVDEYRRKYMTDSS